MRQRLKWAALLLAAALIAAAGAYRWPISSAFVATEFGRQLSDSVGLKLRGPSRAYLTLLPLPTIQLVDIELAGQDGAPMLVAPRAKARLALGALLSGRLQLSNATLRRPTVLIDLDRSPFAKGSALARLMESRDGAAGETTLGALRFERGLAHIISVQNGVDTLIEDVAGELDWPSLADPMRLDLRATWRGAPATVAARLDNLAQGLAERGTQVSLEIASPVGALKLAGALKLGAKNFFEGAITADFPSTAALARLFGAPTNFASDGRLALAGEAALNAQMLTLSEMRLTA